MLIVGAFAGCSNQAVSQHRCEPELMASGNEVQATSEDIEVWALVFADWDGLVVGAPVFVPVGHEVKIVWRATGEGDLRIRALGPDEASVAPEFGPDGPRGSNWTTHPGEEWGTGWAFPEAGCWSIELQRGESIAYLDVDVRA